MRRWWRVVPAVVLVAATAAASPAAAATQPTLTVTVVQNGLEYPWDLAFLPATGSAIPAGAMLYTERTAKKVILRLPGGEQRVVLDNPAGMWASGETGLMSVEVAADFATSHDFITCHGYKSGSIQDVRVVRWHLNAAFTSATLKRTLVKGLPSTSGRHGGCSLLKGGGNFLFIGTGDAATGKNPQNLYNGGGKVLRVDSRTGAPISSNRWIHSAHLITRQIQTYGQRNVQGLARRGDGTIWSVEQGSYRDDEVNQVIRGTNFGWNPVPRTAGDPSYNEGANSPMTDHSLPGSQMNARWSSGDPTIATSGGTFVYGSAWGSSNGALAISSLKDETVRLLMFSKAGVYQRQWKPSALDGTYGRLRAAVLGPDGSLYVTTSNGTDDKILKVTPS
ncbi:MAG: glucose dehydrogenase [Aeromicrobium sp.]|nr:glucose dehydrogenase [Aeromicrobium sp.]